MNIEIKEINKRYVNYQDINVDSDIIFLRSEKCTG